jgi:hypothetical protein
VRIQRAGVACRASQQLERLASEPAGLAKEWAESPGKLVRVVVVGHVGTGRAGDLHAQALGEPPGCLPVDAVGLGAYQHHYREGDGGQGCIVGQISLVGSQLGLEEGPGRGLHALAKGGLEAFPVGVAGRPT